MACNLSLFNPTDISVGAASRSLLNGIGEEVEKKNSNWNYRMMYIR